MFNFTTLYNTVTDAAEKIILKAATSNDESLLDLDPEDDIVEDAMESAMLLNSFGDGSDQELGYHYMATAALALAKAIAMRVDSDLENIN